MGFVKRLAVLACVFLLYGICVGQLGREFEGHPYAGTRQLRSLHLPGWTDRDIEDDTGLLNQLEADASLYKVYSTGDSPPVTVYVGYYDSLRQSSMSHAPQVCFSAQGWELKSEGHISLGGGGNPIPASELVVAKQKNRQLVYYWYQSQRHLVPDLFRLKLLLLFDRLRFGKEAPQGNAFVRISTDLDAGRAEGARRLAAFVEEFMPVLRKGFFGNS